MMGGDHSQPYSSGWDNIDDEESMFGGEESFLGAGALGRSTKRIIIPANGSPGAFDQFFAMNDAMKLADAKARKSGLPTSKGGAAHKKPNNHAGRTYKGKTMPLKSVTSNKFHEAVFPNMRVPVYMHKQNGKKGRSGYSSGRGLTSSGRTEDVPVMSVQCPMPGGTSVATQTDPVQKVSWGPLSRIEASDQARDLVKQLRKAVKAAKQGKSRRTGSKENKNEESETDGEETSKPIKSPKKNGSVGVTKQGDTTAPHHVNSNDGVGLDTASVAETGASTDSMGNPNHRGFLRAPPGTPPDSVFLKVSSAAALSMPTLPTMHHIADTKLVEQFRLQHAKDPEAFEQETLDIKQGLIEAKANRGGKPWLLREEYTVELASREGAEHSEKWFKGQGKSREFPGLRSRANSLRSQLSTGSFKMRGGHIEDSTASVAKKDPDDSGETVIVASEPIPSGLPEIEHDLAIPTLELPALAIDDKPTTSSSSAKGKKKSTTGDAKLTIREIKKALSRLDITENVSKITTYGTVRHQSSVKRETNDHGEKRTVKTWIEVVEVYDVPKPQKLTVKDIIKTIDEEQTNSEGEWEDDTDNSDSEDDAGKKEIRRMQKKKSKGKKSAGKSSGYDSDTSSSTSSSDSGSGSASDHDSVDSTAGQEFYDPGETGPEALLRSLSRLEGGVDAGSISRLTTDLGALMAGLGAEGMLEDHEGSMDF